MGTRRVVLVIALGAVLAPVTVRAADPLADGVRTHAAELRHSAWRVAALTASALAADALLASISTPTCRICVPPFRDFDAREDLVWAHPAVARTASDVLANAAIPVLAAADAVRSGPSAGNVGRDLLVVAEAASLSSLATGFAKDIFARRRPGYPATGVVGSAADHSFWSGHTAFAFAVVSAQAMQDTIRGDRRAPWVWAAGLTLATAVGYLRVAGDAHWFTDVLAGAVAGTVIGVGVPLLEVRLVRGVTLAPAPGGIAVRF